MSQGRMFQVEGMATAKALNWEHAACVATARRPVWLEGSEREQDSFRAVFIGLTSFTAWT